MKAVLEFNLPNDDYAHQAALRGADYHTALLELAEYLRSRLKYAELSKEARQELEEVRCLLSELAPNLNE